MNTYKATIWVGRALGNAALLLAVLTMIMPFLYMVFASFKPGGELYTIPLQFFPKNIYIGNFQLLFERTNFIRWFLNSSMIAIVRTALSIVFSLLAGYAFAKFEFKFKAPLFVLLLATLTLPIYVILVPLYSMVVRMGWTNSYASLILPFMANALGVFLARQFLLSVPNEMLEAARIDGANEWRIFWQIILPIAQPVTATMGILFFSAAWRDYIWPLIVLNDDDKFTVSLGLPTLIGPFQQEYGAVMAGSFMVTLPIIIIFLIMQRRFIEGIMAGAIKG
jgi:ABC-type glycerol-3-phosphate transport system permease component